MPAIHKKPSKLRLEFVANTDHSVCGGLPAIEALCTEFGLWEKLRALPGLDPRTRKERGFGPEVMVAQLLYSFCSGGVSLSDAEELNQEPLARLLARVPEFADQSTVGQWLRAQSTESIAGLWALTQDFVRWVLARAARARWTYCQRLELFFDDTQIEVSGRKFEGAKMNYDGKVALSWQALWAGPFLFEAELGEPGDVSSALPGLLARHRGLWEKTPGDFLADSGSSAAKYLGALAGAGLAQWSVSYNKWTSVLDRTAAAQPEAVWGPPRAAVWRDGSPITEQHGYIRHQPDGAKEPGTFAVVRFKKSDEFWWNYRYVACEGPRAPGAAAVFARHKLKGEKEQLFKEVLHGLDLHHPPCAELNANRMFYALGALAYNLLVALKILHLPEECQGWQVKTLLRKILLLPARLVQHARVLVARILVPAERLSWWVETMRRLWPQAQPGRPAG
jgi:Transposase DDE domain group 1